MITVQPGNSGCRTHYLHKYGTYPSRCLVAWIIIPESPLGSGNNYAVDRGEK